MEEQYEPQPFKVNTRRQSKLEIITERHEKKWNKRIRNMGYRYI